MNQAWFPQPVDNQSTQFRGEIWRQGSAQAFQGPTDKWTMGLSDALPINTQPQCTSMCQPDSGPSQTMGLQRG